MRGLATLITFSLITLILGSTGFETRFARGFLTTGSFIYNVENTWLLLLYSGSKSNN